jgi:hypothetical protein
MNEQSTLPGRRSSAYSGYQSEQNERRPLWANNPMVAQLSSSFPRQIFVGALLIVALFAFEVFNFDTTQYALKNLLGDVRFAGIGWATILAIAFCGIDFAGLAYLFMPERFHAEARETWYLMGAWLLGATMNALMTWWAVSLTILQTQAGNELLSHQQLLHIVPIFVAVLVWLTRILFISAFSVAGSHLLQQRQGTTIDAATLTARAHSPILQRPSPAELPRLSEELPGFLRGYEPATPMTAAAHENNGRLSPPVNPPLRQRPPNADNFGGLRQRAPAGAHMRGRR